MLYTLILLIIITRWPVLQKVHDPGSFPVSLLVNIRFQFLFHSPLGVLFTFPSRYLFAIGHQGVFSLRGWSPCVPTEFHVLCGTLLKSIWLSFWIRDFHSLWFSFPANSSITSKCILLIWAVPRSLAATQGIEFSFFSSGYLDVSVHLINLILLCIYNMILEVCSSGFPHSESPGLSDICS